MLRLRMLHLRTGLTCSRYFVTFANRTRGSWHCQFIPLYRALRLQRHLSTWKDCIAFLVHSWPLHYIKQVSPQKRVVISKSGRVSQSVWNYVASVNSTSLTSMKQLRIAVEIPPLYALLHAVRCIMNMYGTLDTRYTIHDDKTISLDLVRGRVHSQHCLMYSILWQW
jgi:hypothetical protein